VEVVLPDELDLCPVGFFEELGLGFQFAGRLRDSIRGLASPDEEMVVGYLSSGYVLLDVPETAADVINSDKHIVGGPSLVSDGTWVWRLDLPYYVRTYHLARPRTFLEYLRQRDYAMPVLSALQLEIAGEKAMRFF
jgi:hypothetical protein